MAGHTSPPRHPARRDDSGAAALEFALVSMLLIPLLMTMTAFAIILWGHQAADHAAREGARLAAVGVDDCDAWRSEVQNRGLGASIDAADATFEIEDGPDGVANPGDTITVEIIYEIVGAPGWMLEASAALLPGSDSFKLEDGSGTVKLVARSITRNEAPPTSASSPLLECS